MEARERIAYVRGLLEGSEGSGAEAKSNVIWQNILDICESLAESIAELRSGQEDLEEYVFGIDADLCELEDAIFGDAEDAMAAQSNGFAHGVEPGGVSPAGGAAAETDGTGDDDEADEDAADGGDVRADCPRCGEEVYFEESLLYDDNVEISCPECGEVLYRSHDTIVDEESE